MSYYVYILYSERKCKYYTGSCENIHIRLEQHNNGLSHYTKIGIPWKLVKLLETENRTEALKLENKIKKRGTQRFLNDSP